MNSKWTSIVAVSLWLTSCFSHIEQTLNHQSYANSDQIAVTHMKLKIDVNFDSKNFDGEVEYSLQPKPGVAAQSVTQFILDTSDIKVKKVSILEGEKWVDRSFTLGEKAPIYGTPLIIKLLPGDLSNKAQSFVQISYSTLSTPDAFQWLTPEMTSSKKEFLFSLNEPIFGRGWIPSQDSPAERATWDATVSVPASTGLTPMMSGVPTETKEKSSDKVIKRFVMNQPVPSYLIALAVGDVKYVATGPRTGIYAEAALLESAKKEFKDLEKIISTIESMYGPYKWGQFTVLVMPSGFAYGGMENPNLVYLNSAVITGDGSMLSVVVHEASHFWSGNLVTNEGWEHFWLNEGVTTYVELRTLEKMYGKYFADLTLAKRHEMAKTQYLDEMQANNKPEFTSLIMNLEDKDPDAAVTPIQYAKGAFFLRALERRLGRKQFDQFLSNYFKQHAFKTANTEEFLNEYESFEKSVLGQTKVSASTQAGKVGGLSTGSAANLKQWMQDWVTKPYIHAEWESEHTLLLKSPELVAIRKVAERAFENINLFKKPAHWTDISVGYFLDTLFANSTILTADQMNTLGKAINVAKSTNAEIEYRWLNYVIKNNIAVDQTNLNASLEKFLSRIGRGYYIAPVYSALIAGRGQEKAREIYLKHRSMYSAGLQAKWNQKLGAEK